VFSKEGTITAGNASKINDAGCAVGKLIDGGVLKLKKLFAQRIKSRN